LLGSFTDCEKRLQYLADLGFDVLYLPPIHPIGFTNRKGKNNSVIATGADPGSPWAIGSAMGGHKSVEPSLGTLDDFVGLINAATSFGIEIAMDIAFQCSPDHPYVKEHPEWFQTRPDGTIQFAENPPKKYEDIVPFNFETNEWKALWEELKDVFLFWIDKGITIFRVDNPHTKPLSFWEWIIKEIRHIYPDVIFLSEAFTRPKIMYRLAKVGFSQSYSYFTWRNTKQELITYFKDLTNTSIAEYFRPCLWPATPDILPEFLQFGGDNAFAIRFILAATLSSCYGIYGPAFELAVNSANPGKEEYLNSEKYEIKHWIFPNDSKLKLLISKVNAIRREYESLQVFRNLHFHDVTNEQLLFFSKMSTDMSGAIFVVVNLDPFHTQEGVLTVPFSDLGLKHDDLDIFHDLLTGERFFVSGNHITVKLNPDITPAYIFKVVARMGRETKFEYY
jgi:starch synthase (maltosyl-transferring)